jgi:predicted dehydrogenase
LEKPISPTEAECREVIDCALKHKRLVVIGHILRYTAYFAHIKALIDSGELGEVVSIAHQESAGFWKVAHSYVRGNWANSKKSSPIILAKCSHDIDLFVWWIGKKCKKVSSFGSIKLFRREMMPKGAACRCVDCPPEIEKRCVWSALNMYVNHDELKYLFADRSEAAMRRLIEETEYGKCVYQADNDVPDHQTVTMEFEGGATVSHVMTGFTAQNIRTTRIALTRGEILGDGENLDICRFDGNAITTGVPLNYRLPNRSRHGGGDFNIVSEMIRMLRRGDPDEIRETTEQALQSHLICFAAEKSRLDGGKVVEIN